MTYIKKMCGTCRHWAHADGAPANQGLCRYNPPVPLFMGMQQSAPNVLLAKKQPQSVQPIVMSFFPPMLANGKCSRWGANPEDVDVENAGTDHGLVHEDQSGADVAGAGAPEKGGQQS